jgi:Uma2 family endonuclease
MGTTATRITAERYYENSVEGDRKQLVDGAIVVSEPRPVHGFLQARLAGKLSIWVEAGEGRGLVIAPTDVVMDQFNVYGPDLLWISERHRPPDLTRRLERVPDLCVEIRSPSTWRHDIGAKKRVYESGGLPELWLVDDVSEAIYAFRRSSPGLDRFDVALELGRGDVLTSAALPGFSLPLDELFRF